MSAKEQFDALFADGTVAGARSAALQGGLRHCSIKSILWRVFLELLPERFDEASWEAKLKEGRDRYNELAAEYIINPEDDNDTDPMLDNPLMASEETDSKWSRFFEDEEIQNEIKNDVTRTYPDIEFFRRESTQTLLTRVLFIYVRLYPDPGYRQGMNELLAPVALVLSREYGEATRPYGDETGSLLRSAMDSNYLEHDAFTMFCKLMEGMSDMYANANATNTSSALRSQMNALGGRGESFNPAVQRCQGVHKLLEKADPEVHTFIAKKHQIEPQLYVLRWLRLMFTREFHIDDVMLIWDAILADSAELRLIDHLCVSMIVFIRADVLEFPDVSQVLTRLMKFPPVESIMVIVDKALMIAGGTSCAKQPSMMYGHLPRMDKAAPHPALSTPPAPAPAPPEPEPSPVTLQEDPLAAIAETAETVVKSTRDLFSVPEDPPFEPTTGFTPRPGNVSPIEAKDPLSAFDSPRSNHSEPADFAMGDGGSTHRKVTTTFGPGADGSTSSVVSSIPPSEVALPVEPLLARKKMIKYVTEHEAPRQALDLLDGALNWRDEHTREHHRAMAERLDECVSSLQVYVSATQMFAEPEEARAGREELPAATAAMAQLEAIKSCLILGGEVPPRLAAGAEESGL